MGTPHQDSVREDDMKRSSPIQIPAVLPTYQDALSGSPAPPLHVFTFSPGSGSPDCIGHVTTDEEMGQEPNSPPPRYSTLPPGAHLQDPGNLTSEADVTATHRQGSNDLQSPDNVMIGGHFDGFPDDHGHCRLTPEDGSQEPSSLPPRYSTLPPGAHVTSPSAPPMDSPRETTSAAAVGSPREMTSPLPEYAQGPTGSPRIQRTPSAENRPDIHLTVVTTMNVADDVIADCLFDDALDENGSSKHIFIMTKKKVVKYLLTGQFLREWARAQAGCTSGEMCIDSGRDLIVITAGKRLIRRTRLGVDPGVIYNGALSVQKAGTMSAITYYSKADQYIVVDSNSGNRKVLVVKPNTGDVARSVKDKKEPLRRPVSVSCHSEAPHDLIAVSDHEAHNIKLFDIKGKIHMSLGSEGHGRCQLKSPRGICMDSQGRVVVCDHGNRRVVRFCPPVDTGTWRWECVLAPEQLFEHHPCHVDISSNGHLLVTLEALGGGVLQTVALFKGYH